MSEIQSSADGEHDNRIGQYCNPAGEIDLADPGPPTVLIR